MSCGPGLILWVPWPHPRLGSAGTLALQSLSGPAARLVPFVGADLSASPRLSPSHTRPTSMLPIFRSAGHGPREPGSRLDLRPHFTRQTGRPWHRRAP